MCRKMILASILAAVAILGQVTADYNTDDGCVIGSRASQAYELTGTSGELTSYKFSAGNYPNDLDCYWSITVPEDMVITLQFPYFDVEGSAVYGGYDTNCAFDNLYIWDNVGDNAWQFCNDVMPSTITSQGNQLFLDFLSDLVVTKRGFRIEWSAASKTGVTIPPPQEIQCGKPKIEHYEGNSGGAGARVIGGQYARPGSWPWQVQLKFRSGHYCGGSLIDPQWVLTAAHCYTQTRYPIDHYSLTYHFGSHDIDIAGPNEVMREAAEDGIYIHPAHVAGAINNDVALVKLSEPVELNDHVAVICLPEPGAAEPPDGTMCYVTGWGYVTNSYDSPTALKQAKVPIVGTDRCKKHMGIYADSVCAGYQEGGHDTCSGDSGGPLHCQKPDNSSWELIGVTSYGPELCAMPNGFGVYARVSYYTEWIRKTMAEQA